MNAATQSEIQRLVSAEEWQLRVDLAACYRLVALYGFSDMVFTHISAKLPESVAGDQHQFLINPYGLMFDEICASSLVKVDMQCNKLIESPHPVNPAGFVIHSAVHEARPKAGCVLHTHTRTGVAVSAQKRGVLPISQQSTFVLASIAYHDYEGVAFREEEKPRLQADLGEANFSGAAQPRPAHGGADHRRCVLVDVHVREHLPDSGRCAGRRFRTDRSRSEDHCGHTRSVAGTDRRTRRRFCLARAAAPTRSAGSELPGLSRLAGTSASRALNTRCRARTRPATRCSRRHVCDRPRSERLRMDPRGDAERMRWHELAQRPRAPGRPALLMTGLVICADRIYIYCYI